MPTLVAGWLALALRQQACPPSGPPTPLPHLPRHALGPARQPQRHAWHPRLPPAPRRRAAAPHAAGCAPGAAQGACFAALCAHLLAAQASHRSSPAHARPAPNTLLSIKPALLAVLSRLWRQHVLVGRPPAPDVYASWREHHDLLRRIVEVGRVCGQRAGQAGVCASGPGRAQHLRPRSELMGAAEEATARPCSPAGHPQVARGAQLVASIEREVHPPGSDARWFLD